MANNGSSSPTWPAFTVYPCCIEDPEQYIISCENRPSTIYLLLFPKLHRYDPVPKQLALPESKVPGLPLNDLLEYPSPYITHIYIYVCTVPIKPQSP